MFVNFLIILFNLVTISLIAIVLVQPGKGFGLESSHSGASKTVFGSSGPRQIQRKVTIVLFCIWLLIVFFLCSLISRSRRSIFTNAGAEEERTRAYVAELEKQKMSERIKKSKDESKPNQKKSEDLEQDANQSLEHADELSDEASYHADAEEVEVEDKSEDDELSDEASYHADAGEVEVEDNSEDKGERHLEED